MPSIRSWRSALAFHGGLQPLLIPCLRGCYEAAEVHLKDIARTRSQMDFDISEIAEVLLLLKDAALPVIQRAYPAGSTEIHEAITALETYIRFTVGRFGHLYAKAIEKELRESEERFRALADFTYDWEYWLTPGGHYMYVSPSCERITGYSSDEFQRTPELLERIVHADDRDVVTKHLREEPIEGSVSTSHGISYHHQQWRGSLA